MSNEQQQPQQEKGSWFFQALFTAYQQMCERNWNVLQELSVTHAHRVELAHWLADMFWRIGLLDQETQTIRMPAEVLDEALLVQLLLRMIQACETHDQLREWTVQQPGWYARQRSGEETTDESETPEQCADLPNVWQGYARPFRFSREGDETGSARGIRRRPPGPL